MQTLTTCVTLKLYLVNAKYLLTLTPHASLPSDTIHISCMFLKQDSFSKISIILLRDIVMEHLTHEHAQMHLLGKISISQYRKHYMTMMFFASGTICH